MTPFLYLRRRFERLAGSVGGKRIWISLVLLASLVLAAVLMGSGIQVASYSLIQSAGSALTQRQTLNFTNGGCVDNAGSNRTDCSQLTQAYSTVSNAGTPVTQRSTLNFVSGVTCADNGGTLATDCTGTGTGGGGSGGTGIITYSGPSLSLAATQYFPAGGGASASTTETNVDVEAPSAVTIGPFYVQLAAALGIGNTTVYTWRKNAMDTAVTCTITGASATTCNDVTHTFTVIQGDLIDVKAVTTGTPAANTVVMATQWGTGGGYATLQNVGTNLTQRTTLNLLNGLGCNDSGSITQCTGYLGVVPPTVASLTWVNQASATTTTVNGVTNMIDSANEEGLHLLCQTAPATPYTITIQMNWGYQPVQAKFPYPAVLAFRDSVSGKLESIEIVGAGATNPDNVAYEVDQWTNATTFSAALLAAVFFRANNIAGFQVSDDGTTNKTWAISIDGSIYRTVATEARTTFLTANQVCWGVRSNASAAQFEQMTLTGWRVH